MDSNLVHSEHLDLESDEKDEPDDDGWANLEAPKEIEESQTFDEIIPALHKTDADFHDERAALEEELARLDSNWKHYSIANSADEKQKRESKALDDLESKLADVEF